MERYDIRVYEWEAVKAEDGDFVLYTDAQATVEALQAQVKELEGNRVPHSMQHVIELQAMNNRLGAQVEALQQERDALKIGLNALRDAYDELECGL